MKKRIAVIFNGNLLINRQGQINSAINRIKYLKALNTFEVDAYCVQEYDWGFMRKIHHQKEVTRTTIQTVDEIDVHIIYKKKIFLDYFFESKLKLPPIYSNLYFHRIAKQLRNYDLIVGHSTIGGIVAVETYRRFKIPYCIVWHGSDIHTNPVANKYIKNITRKIIQNASGNIFVSLSLLNNATKIFGSIPSPHIVYNAPGEKFIKYNEKQRDVLRMKEGVTRKKVIAFVGNLVPVKNIFTLPNIFKNVAAKNNDVVFWVIGDGIHRSALEQKMAETGVKCRFWGNIQPEEMPDIMNCIDVLVLPSFNESFGMVLIEAIACGANAVGSNCGGIPEVIGKENCFDLNDNFENKIAGRIIYMLENEVAQKVNPEYNWLRSARKENRIFIENLNF